MRIFVTGGTGYIGYAVACAMRRRGHEVRALIRDPAKSWMLEREEIRPVLGNLDTPDSYLREIQESEAVIHCAMEWSERGPELDRLAVTTILDAVASADGPRALIYTSGVWIYGDTGPHPVGEEAEPHPVPIARHRLEIEKKVLEAAAARVKTVVTRPGCVYGGRGGLTGLWFAAAERGVVEIPGDGNNHWSMVHVDDLAGAYVMILEHQLSGRIVNITRDDFPTLRELAEASARAAGRPGAVRLLSRKEAENRFGVMVQGLRINQKVSSAFLRNACGWRPFQPGFVDGVNRYFRAWKAHRESTPPTG